MSTSSPNRKADPVVDANSTERFRALSPPGSTILSTSTYEYKDPSQRQAEAYKKALAVLRPRRKEKLILKPPFPVTGSEVYASNKPDLLQSNRHDSQKVDKKFVTLSSITEPDTVNETSTPPSADSSTVPEQRWSHTIVADIHEPVIDRVSTITADSDFGYEIESMDNMRQLSDAGELLPTSDSRTVKDDLRLQPGYSRAASATSDLATEPTTLTVTPSPRLSVASSVHQKAPPAEQNVQKRTAKTIVESMENIEKVPSSDLAIPPAYRKTYAAMEKRKKFSDTPKSNSSESKESMDKRNNSTKDIDFEKPRPSIVKETDKREEAEKLKSLQVADVKKKTKAMTYLSIEEKDHRVKLLASVPEHSDITVKVNGLPADHDGRPDNYFGKTDSDSGLVTSPVEENLPQLLELSSKNLNGTHTSGKPAWPTLEPSLQPELFPVVRNEMQMADIREQLDDMKTALSQLQKDIWQTGSRLALRQQNPMTGPQNLRPAFNRNRSVVGSRTSLASAGLNSRPTSPPPPVDRSGSSSKKPEPEKFQFGNLFTEKVPKAQLEAQKSRNQELEQENQYLLNELRRYREQNASQVNLILSKLNVFRAKILGEDLTDLDVAEPGINLGDDGKYSHGRQTFPSRGELKSRGAPSDSIPVDVMSDLKADRDRLAEILASFQSRMDAEKDVLNVLLEQVKSKENNDKAQQKVTTQNLEEIYRKMASLERTQAILAENVWRH
ncbi:uncharacterized protein LOC129597067 [Paramacrobiotus metropolitanus]|uniref:uncharacterized protein LOC129597067 n=1 Tax=Paramacrobiotus metropolitanus TaxID=2943436 RepID=UPI00244603BE|nr:uncharacterized protein LOC129597067 [Paramacrobiotus metropolitanus]XP_055350474.1 uncharacterized protein LOC129597067 [Paramacrobiotus metropolitanus]XP_055350475.1 uncharacterized protein LOC129597067 [Paramacrobiotus metropolitanus]XP_055350476.1 uncharacterized protein LOC129597067 [Paramacrobiotus metropolitanus]